MPSIWGRLVTEIELEPVMHRVGRPRLRQSFAGRHQGWHVSIDFDVARGEVRAVVALSADTVLSGTDTLRIMPREGLGNWSGGALTGDPAFDTKVAILTDEPEKVLLALDVSTRALLVELIESGVWITDMQAIVEPQGTAAVRTLEEAGQLLDSAADLLRAIDAPTPERLIEMAFGDPSPRQRQRAWRHVRRMAGQGTKWVGPLLDAIERHGPDNAPELLEQIAPRAQHRFDAWLSACDRHIVDCMPALFAGLPVAQELGPEAVTEVVRRIAGGFVDPARRPPSAERLVNAPGLVRALLPHLEGSADGLDRLLALPLQSEALRAEVIGTMGKSDPERAAARLAAMQATTAEGERARIEALARLPAGFADPVLVELRPSDLGAVRVLLGILSARVGQAIDVALVTWAVRAPRAVAESRSTGVFTEAAGRLCAALDVAPDGPLVELCRGGLPRPLAGPLTSELIARRPKHGAGWLARHAPDHRMDDPKREAQLLGVLAELGDPAGEERCLAALDGSDFLRVAAARALAHIGTARALEPLDDLTGFFASGDVKSEARAAMEAIRQRELQGPRGGLTVSRTADGGLSME